MTMKFKQVDDSICSCGLNNEVISSINEMHWHEKWLDISIRIFYIYKIFVTNNLKCARKLALKILNYVLTRYYQYGCDYQRKIYFILSSLVL